MTSSPAASDASHESGDEGQNDSHNKAPALKDKECPYCHQKFTSSSLGRHLDQFLSKKKPDGVHDVEEIKKIRAGITRRTARGGKKGGDSNSSYNERSQRDSRAPSAQHSPPQSFNNGATSVYVEALNKSGMPVARDVRFNRIGWQSTGVIPYSITDNPAGSTAGSPVIAHPSTLAGTKRNFSTYAADLPAPSTNETTRALELSLREVLDAVNVATRKAAPLPQPFPFDLTSLTFPSLCLRLLPPPATLFQSSPFSTAESIPLQPPGAEQLRMLRAKIRLTIDQWKWNALSHMQKNTVSNAVNIGEEAERMTQQAQKRIDESLRHVDAAFHYFASNTPEQQYQLWTIELLRAYKTEQDKVKEAKEQIVHIAQEAAALQQQVDHLSRCQWPREMALWPPERNTFTSAVQKELAEGKPTSLEIIEAYGSPRGPGMESIQEDRWDFDKLVNKWKQHVREDRARRGIGGSATMLPPLVDSTADRTASPTGIGIGGVQRSISNPPGSVMFNGQHKSTFQTHSPDARNGTASNPTTGNADKPTTFASQIAAPGQHVNTSRSFAETAYVYPHYQRVGLLGPFHSGMRASEEAKHLYSQLPANDTADDAQKSLTGGTAPPGILSEETLELDVKHVNEASLRSPHPELNQESKTPIEANVASDGCNPSFIGNSLPHESVNHNAVPLLP